MTHPAYDPAFDGASAANITAVLARATMADWHAGLTWYDTAADIAATIGAGDRARGAGILAALSPQITWAECTKLARSATSGRRFKRRGHFKACIAKAAAIYAGDDPSDVLHGPKERAFYCNIAHGAACHPDHTPTHTDGHRPYACVTVDRHALAVAYGRVLAPREVTTYLGRARTYDCVAAMYRAAARAANLPPHVVQAITWVTWRREKGLTP